MTDQIPTTRLTLLLMLGVVVIGSNSLVLSPILTEVARDLRTDPVIAVRAISAYGAATALSALFLGGLVDRLGARRVLTAGAAAMALALAVSALAASWQMLAAAQAVVGAAAGVMLPAIYASATAAAAPGSESRMLGRVLNGWALSLVAGIPASAFIADLAGWRLVYVLLAVMTAAAGLGFARLPRQPRAMQRGPGPLAALRIPGVVRLLLICLGFMIAFYGSYAFLGTRLHDVLGIGPGAAGLVVLAYGVGFGLAGTLLGARVDRIGPVRVLPVVLIVVTGVYLVMPLATQSFAGALALCAFWGLVNHFGLNILVLLMSQRAPAARGAVLGLNSAVTYGAVFAGPLLMGSAYERLGYAAAAGIAAASTALAAALALGPLLRRGGRAGADLKR